jgi:PAS domain S-box-containing protein
MENEKKTKEPLRDEREGLHNRPGQARETDPPSRKVGSTFEALLEAAPDAIIIVDRGGRIILVNAQVEKLFGYCREALLGQPIEILVPERFLKAHVGHRESYHAQPRTRPMGVGLDLAGRRKDGSEFPVEISLSPIETEEGQQVISIVRDISDRKEAERRLRESEQQYRLLFEANPHPMWVFDNKSLRFLAVNEAAVRHYGYTQDEFLAMTIKDIRPPEDIEKLISYLERSDKKADAGLYAKGEWRHCKKDGTIIDVEITRNPISFRGHDAMLVLATDITDRKRAEEKLREKIREMDDFIHVVSHDLKEPLRGIEAFAGFLAEDYAHLLDEEGRRYVHFLKSSAIRMKDLIHDLLTLASISRKAPALQRADLTEILRRVEQDLSYTIEQKKARISVKDPLPTVLCDPTQIREVFKNLLSNAIKFNTSSAPEVEIGVNAQNGSYLFSIRDNGIGIDPRYQERIFGLFERLHPQEEFEGTGAGLAICKKIIEGCGGKIWVESELEKGSTFFFTLPKPDGERHNNLF